jgi:hypothetical protein
VSAALEMADVSQILLFHNAEKYISKIQPLFIKAFIESFWTHKSACGRM